MLDIFLTQNTMYKCAMHLACYFLWFMISEQLTMWANAQRDGRPAEYRWRSLFNALKFG